jgi:hypothetical protein
MSKSITITWRERGRPITKAKGFWISRCAYDGLDTLWRQWRFWFRDISIVCIRYTNEWGR